MPLQFYMNKMFYALFEIYSSWYYAHIASLRPREKNSTDINHRNKARCNWRVAKAHDIEFNGCLISRTEKSSGRNTTYRPSLTVDLRSNYWMQWSSKSEKSGELSPPRILQPSALRSIFRYCGRRKGEKRKEKAGARVRMAIRWNKRPEASGEGEREAALFVRALYSMEPDSPSFTRLWGDSGETNAQSNLTRRDTTDLVSHLNRRRRVSCRTLFPSIFAFVRLPRHESQGYSINLSIIALSKRRMLQGYRQSPVLYMHSY